MNHGAKMQLDMTTFSMISHRGWRTVALATGLLMIAACSHNVPEVKFQARDITGADWGRDFHLVDPTGVTRSLADYRGKVVMLFFGYTNCPDECPTTLTKMAQAVDHLGEDGKRVQGLFVTVDPARDTPAVLTKYVAAFHPSFVGLSASGPSIAATAKDFKVFYAAGKPAESGVYTVDHTSGIFVFDPQGRLRLFMGPRIRVDAMVHDLKLLLDETSKRTQP